MQNTTVQALCNACNSAAHEEASEANIIRTFTINGSISVEENIKYCELGSARERSEGASEKLGVCVVSNTGSGSSSSDVGSLGTLAACGQEGIQYAAPSSS